MYTEGKREQLRELFEVKARGLYWKRAGKWEEEAEEEGDKSCLVQRFEEIGMVDPWTTSGGKGVTSSYQVNQ